MPKAGQDLQMPTIPYHQAAQSEHRADSEDLSPFRNCWRSRRRRKRESPLRQWMELEPRHLLLLLDIRQKLYAQYRGVGNRPAYPGADSSIFRSISPHVCPAPTVATSVSLSKWKPLNADIVRTISEAELEPAPPERTAKSRSDSQRYLTVFCSTGRLLGLRTSRGWRSFWPDQTIFCEPYSGEDGSIISPAVSILCIADICFSESIIVISSRVKCVTWRL